MRRLRSVETDDEGQILILALLFLVALSFLVLTPLSFAWADLAATSSFQQQGKLQYTAQSALDLAIDQFRLHQDDGLTDAGVGSAPTESCPLGLSGSGTYDLTSPLLRTLSGSTYTTDYTANGDTVSVSCIGLAPNGGLGSLGRRVAFSVSCVSVTAAGTFSSCPTGALLGADVEYGDVPGQVPTQAIIVRYWSSQY